MERTTSNGYIEKTYIYEEGEVPGWTKRIEIIKDGEIHETTEYAYESKKKRTATRTKKDGEKTIRYLNDIGRETRIENYDTEGKLREITDFQTFETDPPENSYSQSTTTRIRNDYIYGETMHTLRVLVNTAEEKGKRMSRIWHNIAYSGIPEQAAPLQFLPAPLAESSPYRPGNVKFDHRLSDNGKTIVTTITNLTDTPIAVDKNRLQNPQFDFRWSVYMPKSSNVPEGATMGSGFVTDSDRDQAARQTLSRQAKREERFEEPIVLPIAPGKSLRYEIPLAKILSANKEKFQSIIPQKELEIGILFDDLFLLPRGAESVRSNVGSVFFDTASDFMKLFPKVF